MKNNLKKTAAAVALLALNGSAWAYCSSLVSGGTLSTCFGLTANPGGVVAADADAAKARDAFVAGKLNLGTLNFSQYPVPQGDVWATPDSQTAVFAGSSVTANFVVPGSSQFVLPDTQDDGQGNTLASLGRFNTSPTGDQNRMVLESGSDFTMLFSSAIRAFGFFGTDIGDFGGGLTIELFTSSEAQAAAKSIVVVPPTTSGSGNDQGGSLLFFGFFDTGASYQKIRFVQSSRSDGFGYDDMLVANLSDTPTTPTPEPAGLALMGAALAAAAIARRRKSRQQG